MRIFRHNKLRTVLTVLGVAIGIGVIVFLVSLGYGLQGITLSRITEADTLVSIDMTVVSPDKTLNNAAKQAVEKIPNTVAVEPVAQLSGSIEKDDGLINVTFWGVAQSYFNLEGLSFLTGKAPQEGVVVSTAVANLLGIDPYGAIGKKIALRVFPAGAESKDNVPLDDKLAIEGVIQDSFSPSIYVKRSLIDKYTADSYHSFKVKVASRGEVDAVKTAITAMGYQAQATLDDVGALQQGFRIVRIVLAIFGLIALVVSSIGMLNTMTISLLERTKEIGIMKALGASDSDIWLLFLFESTLMGTMGGLSGLLSGYLGTLVFNFAFNTFSQRVGGPVVDLFATPLQFSLGAIVFAAVIGFLTGIYPARRGARLNPLLALKYE